MTRLTFLVASLLGVLACRPARPATTPAASQDAVADARPLASLAGGRVVVTPVRFVRCAGGPCAAGVGAALDTAIESALRERGLTRWIYPEALRRAYRRNASYSSDPDQLDLRQLRTATAARHPEVVTEPLASQLRGLVALQEEARVVLLPLELRVGPATAGSTSRQQGLLRLALVDARGGAVLWMGEVRSDVVPTSGAALDESLAAHLADLVAAP